MFFCILTYFKIIVSIEAAAIIIYNFLIIRNILNYFLRGTSLALSLLLEHKMAAKFTI